MKHGVRFRVFEKNPVESEKTKVNFRQQFSHHSGTVDIPCVSDYLTAPVQSLSVEHRTNFD
jgi:hypothetical protein